jgi:aryl-alcohol dehydrogenase-like predicted oxidoreductase
MFKKANMQYRKLGNTGLIVSALSYGNFNSHKVIPLEEQVKILKLLFENGVNHIDTAENYTEGKDEEDLGKILKEVNEPRENYVVSTKIWMQPDPSLNSKASTNRKHVK